MHLVTTGVDQGVTKVASQKYAVELVDKHKDDLYKDKDTLRLSKTNSCSSRRLLQTLPNTQIGTQPLQQSCQTTTTTPKTSAGTLELTQPRTVDVFEVKDAAEAVEPAGVDVATDTPTPAATKK
jgi:hypothetical protein